MSRMIYASLLFAMTLTGFGEAQGAAPGKPLTLQPKNDLDVNVWSYDWSSRTRVRTPTAVAGVRG